MGLSTDPEIRKQQLKAINANKKGKDYNPKFKAKPTKNIIFNIAKNAAKEASIGAVATLYPPIVPIYSGYKMLTFGKKICEQYERNNKNNDLFGNIISKSCDYTESKILKKVLDSNASEIAKGVRIVAEDTEVKLLEKVSTDKALEMAKEVKNIAVLSGAVDYITKNVNVNKEIYGDMLEGSVKNAVLSTMIDLTQLGINTVTEA